MRPNPEDKPIIYLESMSIDTIDVAKSHLNWMNFKGNHQLEIDDNPFAFKNVQTINSLSDYEKEFEFPRPRVIVTS